MNAIPPAVWCVNNSTTQATQTKPDMIQRTNPALDTTNETTATIKASAPQTGVAKILKTSFIVITNFSVPEFIRDRWHLIISPSL
ncbi:MAG: hypothetical protein FWF10_03940 [Clostridiales bacterium]|nr:hypothetical protein [Clostridiales bacterium]